MVFINKMLITSRHSPFYLDFRKFCTKQIYGLLRKLHWRLFCDLIQRFKFTVQVGPACTRQTLAQQRFEFQSRGFSVPRVFGAAIPLSHESAFILPLDIVWWQRHFWGKNTRNAKTNTYIIYFSLEIGGNILILHVKISLSFCLRH